MQHLQAAVAKTCEEAAAYKQRLQQVSGVAEERQRKRKSRDWDIAFLQQHCVHPSMPDFLRVPMLAALQRLSDAQPAQTAVVLTED